MRTSVFLPLCFVTVLIPGVSDAQVYRQETPAPSVTASNAPWQVAGEPIFFAGNLYYPAGATVFFDGKIMVRTGAYEGVPLYADVTLEPYSIVYVPIGGTLMQPYERRREGDLAGTVGSRTPSFPIGRDAETPSGWREDGRYPSVAGLTPSRRPTTGAARQSETAAAPDTPFEAVGAVMISTTNRSQTPSDLNFGNGILATPGGQGGVWIDFLDARWYASGPAIPFDAARLEPAGSYNGFPVYRERGGISTRIFVTTLRNGPVAPFERR